MERLTYSLTISGLTAEQFSHVTALLKTTETPEKSDTIDMTSLKKVNPEKTVSEEEDADFGKKPLKAKDLEDDEAEEAEETEESNEEADEEPAITFADVRAALNKYGEKYPDQARAILLGFNIKNPKELSAQGNQKYFEPIYRKVMAKLKLLKKKR